MDRLRLVVTTRGALCCPTGASATGDTGLRGGCEPRTFTVYPLQTWPQVQGRDTVGEAQDFLSYCAKLTSPAGRQCSGKGGHRAKMIISCLYGMYAGVRRPGELHWRVAVERKAEARD